MQATYVAMLFNMLCGADNTAAGSIRVTYVCHARALFAHT